MNEAEKPAPGPAWPLFLVAGLSFVPILGIFFGGAGATWGLISSRRKAMRAALIAMAGALLNIAAIMLITIFSTGKSGGLSEVWAETSKLQMTRVVIDLEKYHEKEHAYPSTLKALPGYSSPLQLHKSIDQSAGPFVAQHEFMYTVADDGATYDLYGMGPDKKYGTADDVRPVVPDSLKARSGFRPPPAGVKP